MGISADLIALTNVAGSTDNVSGFETIRVSNALGGNLTTANVQAGIATVELDAAAAGGIDNFDVVTFAVNAGTYRW